MDSFSCGRPHSNRYLVAGLQGLLIAASLLGTGQSETQCVYGATLGDDGKSVSQGSVGKSATPSIRMPRLDEIAYWRKVKQMSFSGEVVTNILRLKPKYRADILSKRMTLETIPYSKEERAADEKWIHAQQQQEKNFKPAEGAQISVAGYDIDKYVGYKCGIGEIMKNCDGFCYKVFFDFKDATRDLSPQLYMQFVERLDKARFLGDSKVSMSPGSMRFFYNNVIVHTATPENAKLAEKIGLELFGSRLECYATGVDVYEKKIAEPFPNNERRLMWERRLPMNSRLAARNRSKVQWIRPVDWHHFP